MNKNLRRIYAEELANAPFPTEECRAADIDAEAHGTLTLYLADIAGLASRGERLSNERYLTIPLLSLKAAALEIIPSQCCRRPRLHVLHITKRYRGCTLRGSLSFRRAPSPSRSELCSRSFLPVRSAASRIESETQRYLRSRLNLLPFPFPLRACELRTDDPRPTSRTPSRRLAQRKLRGQIPPRSTHKGTVRQQPISQWKSQSYCTIDSAEKP